MDWPNLTAAFVAGLIGSIHCFGMCGGIASALQLAIPNQSSFSKWLYLINFNLGRIISYSLLGWLSGWLGFGAAKAIGADLGMNILRFAGAIFLLLMACYIGRWWMILSQFERLGIKLFNPIKNLGKKFLPLKHPGQAFSVGIFWGWMPCGLVYSSLAFAASSANASESAQRMLAFGLGTLPAVVFMGHMANSLRVWLQKPATKQLAAISLVLVAVWTIQPLIMALVNTPHTTHSHH